MNFRNILRAALASLATTSLVLGISATPANAANETTLTIGGIINVTSWDPSQADHAHKLVYYQTVYDNLILRDPKGNYKPNLASDFKVSSNFTSITFTLRKDVTFTDGEKFNAAVAKANMDRFISGGGPWSKTFAGGKVTTNGDWEVTLTLPKPEPDLLYLISVTNSFMASPKALGTADLKTVPVGSGPYVYDKSSKPGVEYVFTANPKYWDKSKQKFKKVVLKVLDSSTARLNAIMSGQVNATLLDAKTTPTAQKNKKLKLTSWENDIYGLMLWDREGKINDALAKKEVRQAINFALDRKALLKTLQGGFGTVTTQAFGTKSGVYDSKLDSYYTYNPTKAKELLAKAGYPNGFTLDMPTWGNTNPAEIAAVEKYLGDVGIKVKWINASLNDTFGGLLAGKYAATTFGLTQGTAWYFFNLAIAGDASRNVLKTKSTVVNEAEKRVQANPFSTTIKKELGAINKYLVEEAWFAPFYRSQQLWLTSERINVLPQVGSAVPYLYNYSPSGK